MLDCNGNKIELGDHIRVIAEATNEFLRTWRGGDLPDDVWMKKDSFGTLVNDEDEGLVVKGDDGIIRWMIDPDLYDDDDREPCLEIVRRNKND